MPNNLIRHTTHLVRVPDESPARPVLDYEDCVSRQPVEVVTEEEMKCRGNEVPRPQTILDRPVLSRPSLVTPIEVAGGAFVGFIAALLRLVSDTAEGVAAGVKMTYSPGPPARLRLEATGSAVWGCVLVKATGGEEECWAVMPGARALAVAKDVAGIYTNVVIGMDELGLMLGSYALPYAGRVADFPVRTVLYTGESRAVMPAHYMEAIPTRVGPARSVVPTGSYPGGILIDFERKVAVAADGERTHLLKLTRMHVEKTSVPLAPVVVPIEFFRFLAAVVNGEWVPIQIHERQLAVASQDFAALADVTVGFPEWQTEMPGRRGYWILDKTALLGLVRDAARISRIGRFALDIGAEKLTVVAANKNGETFRKGISARRYEAAAPIVTVDLRLDHVIDAVTACTEGLIRFAYEERENQPRRPATICGESEDFLAMLQPVRRSP